MLRALFLALLLLAAAWADDISGPLRLTITTEAWGTIFYLPAELKDYDYIPDPGTGLRIMQGKPGKVTIQDAGIGCYNITGPKGSITVEGGVGDVKVNFFGQKFQVAHVKTSAVDELVVRLPDDEIRYELGRHDIVVHGKHGQMRITETEGDYKVQSSKGTYSYSVTDGGGFKVRGAPLVNFPYMYRGLLFKSAGVGVFVDFKKLEPDSPLFRFTEWQPMLVYSR